MKVLQLQVIATTEEGTRAALIEARQVARRLNVDRVILLVPQTDSSVVSVDESAEAGRLVDDYRQLARQVGVDVTVRLCVCGGYDEALRWMLPGRSMVVLGGRRRWWWPTREQRIADELERIGHNTVFAEA